MTRAWRFALVLIVGLGLFTWAASIAVNKTTARWLERTWRSARTSR